MQPLSEVLTDTKPTAEKLDRSNDLSSMPVHGLTIEDGKMITPSTGKPLKNPSHNEQGRQHFEGLCLKHDEKGQGELIILLADCFDTMKLYGKEPEQLESLTRMFKRVLGRFSWQEIEQAFDQYLAHNTEMPTPADIVKIIEPPAQPRKWCGAMYIQLCKQRTQGQFMSNEELDYIRDYESAVISGEAESGAVEEAKRVNKQYWLEG